MVLIFGVDMTQIGTIGQAFLHRQPQFLADSPQQFRTNAPGLIPELKSVVIPVCKTKHSLLQELNGPLGQSPLPHSVLSYLGAKKHMGPVFHQRHKSQLRKGALAPTDTRPSKSLFVHFFVSHIHCAAIQAYQTPAPVPSAPGFPRSNRPNQLIMQLPQRFHPQSSSSLRDPGFTRNLYPNRRIEQPLNALQQTPQHLTIRGCMYKANAIT